MPLLDGHRSTFFICIVLLTYSRFAEGRDFKQTEQRQHCFFRLSHTLRNTIQLFCFINRFLINKRDCIKTAAMHELGMAAGFCYFICR